MGLKLDSSLFSPVSGSTTVSLPIPFIISSVDPVSNAGPDVDHLVVALARGDETFLVLLQDLLDLSLRLVDPAPSSWAG